MDSCKYSSYVTLFSVLFPSAVPGVQWRQVHEEDPDRGGLRVAGQGRPSQASGQLAQAARQHRPDPLIEGGSILKNTKSKRA